MATKKAPSNTDDIIDSRDVIERIDELESELFGDLDDIEEETEREVRRAEIEAENHDEAEELEALKKLQEEAEGYAADWHRGEALIRDSYFKKYAQDFAEDIGAMNNAATWPANCIDWDKAASELQMDYTAVDFDGVTYWIR